MTATVTTRVAEEVLRQIDEFSADKNMDRATMLRNLIEHGLEEERRRKVLLLYKNRRISMQKAASMLRIDLLEMIDLMQKEGLYLDFLAKLGKLEFLEEYELLVPSQVVDELRVWEKGGKEAYVRLMEWLAQADVAIKEADMLPKLPKKLDVGEKAVISLAVKEEIKTVLIDERKARIAAKVQRLKTIGTLAIINQQLKKNKITVKECRQTMLELVKLGYRIKEELLAELLLKLEEPESKK
ncbi:hypothetical protein HYV83_04625 [Candidatus Woesearchaeota archaeon]|nr:hypothetical protein [Candidatus Woesearchaeota archaeon]